jgi:amino acid transporter
MNRTQKGALAVLVITIVLLIFSITIPIAFFNEKISLRILPLAFLVLAYTTMGVSVILLRKRRPSEVDYDERDIAIKQKAVFASYVTLWILVFLACTIPVIINDRWGNTLTVPPSLLPIALFLMFITVMLVYALTVLVQYGRGGKENE